eukprot:Blabericola_migrator_1__6724@NODE_33_length_18162_cov_161_418900_g29_i0_p2_GENE_NODE_33_length_18162_cov_161_418900_g29_i0NODE_33_length_18162_cov_161_418900_g29_i0_p2_ORF_typecomplete_len953_score163_23ANAPC4_WD40/PF12894_7/2_6e03ANAPC4_WD40/PF12894_7/0_054ANAPC4_WD40/PF12894_7/0_00083ANAPC4_WD40/PF12894_7/1_7e03eIF2A/PF08662_11/2_6e07WD40/PF00400_32/1_9e02WD40/PF00400_32/0_016WD40/PF00400_32/0_4WD40/PF00400_32/1_3e04Cytochrom_D1/PF02239_16/0_0019Cytochrom_D1/PF02239_16/0_00033DUF2415/PF10313_9
MSDTQNPGPFRVMRIFLRGNRESEDRSTEEREDDWRLEPSEEPSLAYFEQPANQVRRQEDVFISNALEVLLLSSLLQQQQTTSEGATTFLQSFLGSRSSTDLVGSDGGSSPGSGGAQPQDDTDGSDQGDIRDERCLWTDTFVSDEESQASSQMVVDTQPENHHEHTGTKSPWILKGTSAFFGMFKNGFSGSRERPSVSAPPVITRRRLSDATPLDQAAAVEAYYFKDHPQAFWKSAPRQIITLDDTNNLRAEALNSYKARPGINNTRSAFLISNGVEKQGFEFEGATRRQSLRNKRRSNLRYLLDQTRNQMRRRGSLTRGPNQEYQNRQRRIDVYKCNLEKVALYKIAKFHGCCSPSYDHFQLKKLLSCVTNQDLFFLQYWNHQIKQDINFVKRTHKPFPLNLFGDGDNFPNSPMGPTCVFHYNTVSEKYDLSVGPWFFPSLNWILPELSRSLKVSLSSSAIYSLGVSEHYTAMADSTSSLLLVERNENDGLNWILCQRVSFGLEQITNCLQMIEGDLGCDQEECSMFVQLIQQQAEGRGRDKVEAGVSLLERSMASLMMNDRCLKRMVIQTLRSLSGLHFRRTRRRMATGSYLNLRRGLIEAAFSTITFNTLNDVVSNSEAVTFVEAGETREEGPVIATVEDTDTRRTPGSWTLNAAGQPILRHTRHIPRLSRPNSTDENDLDPQPPRVLTIFTASNDRTVREYKLNFKKESLLDLKQEEVRDRVCILRSGGGFATFIPTDDPGVIAIPILTLVTQWDTPFRANHVAVHPLKDLLLVVGDHPSTLIYSRSQLPSRLGRGARQAYLCRLGISTEPLGPVSHAPLFSARGHHDCGFAAAWAPDCFTFATGNDDETINIWDLRHLRAPIVVRKTSVSACRSLTYSPDGRFLVSAESEDVAVIYDVESNYTKVQKVPFFGGCTGVAFADEGHTLFVGVAAPHQHGGIIELYQDTQ